MFFVCSMLLLRIHQKLQIESEKKIIVPKNPDTVKLLTNGIRMIQTHQFGVFLKGPFSTIASILIDALIITHIAYR